MGIDRKLDPCGSKNNKDTAQTLRILWKDQTRILGLIPRCWGTGKGLWTKRLGAKGAIEDCFLKSPYSLRPATPKSCEEPICLTPLFLEKTWQYKNDQERLGPIAKVQETID